MTPSARALLGRLGRLGRLAALVGVAAPLSGCPATPSAAEREQASVEGRNLAGSSAPSRDDRIPVLVGEPIGPERGCLPGAFAYASAPARLLGWVLGWLPARTPADPALAELGELLAAHPSAHVRASIAALRPATGLHLRVEVHEPERATAGRATLGAELLAWLDRGDGAGEPSCPALALGSARWLGCAHDRLDLARLDGDALILDFVWAPELGDLGVGADDGARRELAQAALDRRSGAAPAEVERLRGDAIAWVDAGGVWAAGPAVARWLGADPTALEPLVVGSPLLDGVTVELDVAPERVVGRLRWRIAAGAEARAAEVFTLDPVDADVPSVASLCAGQQVCVRARGLPAAGRFIGLATGPYADPAALGEALAAEPALAALSLALTSWPHAVAALASWPSRAGDPGEALVRGTLAEIGGRVLGFGLAHGEAGTLVYARVGGLDLGRLRDYLELAGAQFTAAELAGVDGRVEVGATPRASLGRWSAPRRSYAWFDPGEAWGWLVLADDDDQLAWLAAREHDDGAVPIVYVEVAALAGRADTRVRAQLSATPARVPELRFAVGALAP